jgi:hypothetical protein
MLMKNGLNADTSQTKDMKNKVTHDKVGVNKFSSLKISAFTISTRKDVRMEKILDFHSEVLCYLKRQKAYMISLVRI